MVEWSGRTSAYAHKHEPWQGADLSGTPNGVRKVYFLDAQWSTCPVEVEEEVKDLWGYNELGNDRYILKSSISDLLEQYSNDGSDEDHPYEVYEVERWTVTYNEDGSYKKGEYVTQPGSVAAIVQYLREQGVSDDDEVIIHWWW